MGVTTSRKAENPWQPQPSGSEPEKKVFLEKAYVQIYQCVYCHGGGTYVVQKTDGTKFFVCPVCVKLTKGLPWVISVEPIKAQGEKEDVF